MENLNAEQVKKVLECCRTSEKRCSSCPLAKDYSPCSKTMADNALALITSQEQRIGAQDMTISELRKRAEKAEHDADRYAQRIKELTIDLEAMRGAANSYKMHNKELTEENERLRELGTTKEIEKEIVRRETKADTVRKMQERLINHFDECGAFTDMETDFIALEIDNVAEEFLRGR